MPGLHGLDPQRDGAVCLSDARRAEQDDVLGALDKAEPGELVDLLAVDRGLKLEVEVVQALDPWEADQLVTAQRACRGGLGRPAPACAVR